MESSCLDEDAEACRQLALCYLGRPEASFLLRAARAFDQLAKASKPAQRLIASSPPATLDTASLDAPGADLL